MSIQPIYTWSTPEGTLDLLPAKKGYAFCLTSKIQTQVQIPFTQSHSCLFSVAQKVEKTVCEHYLPTLNQDQGHEWTVTFELSTTPEFDIPSQQPKDMSLGFSFGPVKDTISIPFVPVGPSHRHVTRGLNMQGTCDNPVCDTKGEVVFIRMGMGDPRVPFNIGKIKNMSCCPTCKQKILSDKINNLGFWNCNYTIEGRRIDQEEVFSKTAIAPKKHYTTFEEGEKCRWEYLEVTTTPLQAPAEDVPAPPPATGSCVLL